MSIPRPNRVTIVGMGLLIAIFLWRRTPVARHNLARRIMRLERRLFPHMFPTPPPPVVPPKKPTTNPHRKGPLDVVPQLLSVYPVFSCSCGGPVTFDYRRDHYPGDDIRIVASCSDCHKTMHTLITKAHLMARHDHIPFLIEHLGLLRKRFQNDTDKKQAMFIRQASQERLYETKAAYAENLRYER